jgi:hypothetical protein
MHKTTDGFFGYNTGTLDGTPLVHSYNGILIIGDDLGETGVGYYGKDYADFRRAFECLYSFPSITRQIDSLSYEDHLSAATNDLPATLSFIESNELFEQKKRFDLYYQIEQDKTFVKKHIHIYPSKTIEAANIGGLRMSTCCFGTDFNPHKTITENMSRV